MRPEAEEPVFLISALKVTSCPVETEEGVATPEDSTDTGPDGGGGVGSGVGVGVGVGAGVPPANQRVITSMACFP